MRKDDFIGEFWHKFSMLIIIVQCSFSVEMLYKTLCCILLSVIV